MIGLCPFVGGIKTPSENRQPPTKYSTIVESKSESRRERSDSFIPGLTVQSSALC